MNELVTVIIPSYNRSALLSRAVKSVFGQTYHSWEVIIVDDASTDDTEKIANSFAQQDSRIKYIKLDKNGGACIARNVGIENAKGKYITFLDSDDEYLPRKIELQVHCFKNSAIQNLGVVSCGRQDVRNGVVYFKWIPSKRGNIVESMLKKERVGANTSFLMVKKEVLDTHNLLFDPEMPAGQDWDFLIRVCQHANFDFVPEPLVKIHHHSGERVYTTRTSLIAIEKQYLKNKNLLLKDASVHDKFLMKMVTQNYVYGHPDTALSILDTRMIHKNLKTNLWKAGIKAFPRYGTMPSKVVYRMLKFLCD